MEIEYQGESEEMRGGQIEIGTVENEKYENEAAGAAGFENRGIYEFNSFFFM